MAQILLVGTDAPMLEGLTQSLAVLGHEIRVAVSLSDARDAVGGATRPLIAVVDRGLAVEGAADAMRIPLESGGALVLYRLVGGIGAALSPALQRAVLADLTLPLERNRLVALVQSVEERSRATGRAQRTTPPETRAL